MSRLKLAIVIVLLLPVVAGAQPWRPHWVEKTAELDADAAAVTGHGVLYGIILATDGTNAVTVSIYDNTSGSGTELIPTIVIPTSATQRTSSIGFGIPVHFATGCYVDITTAGTVGYMVYYFSE